jgi:hypothetical protein
MPFRLRNKGGSEMPFKPHHLFQNRKTLERIVADLQEKGKVTNEIHENFYRYHPAMIHKLRSAKYNLDRLSEKLNTTSIFEAAAVTGDFMFEVNMFIDGFFYNAGSALDILARVVLTLFGEPVTGQIYFQTAHTNIARSHPGDPILPRLDNPPWKIEFSNYRNALTHELILASRYHIEIDNTGVKPTSSIVFPLPDDPRAMPIDRRYRKYPNALNYTAQQFRRILSLANTLYGDILARARANDSLPI